MFTTFHVGSFRREAARGREEEGTAHEQTRERERRGGREEGVSIHPGLSLSSARMSRSVKRKNCRRTVSDRSWTSGENNNNATVS
jgi:hypothetical protein